MDPIIPSVPVGDFFSFLQITDPTTVTGEEIMLKFDLMEASRGFKEFAGHEELTRLEDLGRRRPEQLPGCFLTRGVFSPEGWQTKFGRWLPKKLSSIGNMLGVKTTLEFEPNNGTKVDIGNMELYNCVVRRDGEFFIDESSALCCVFPKGKGSAPDPCMGFVAPPLGEWQEDIRSNFDATKCCPLRVEDYGVGDPKKRKRGGGSEIWKDFTKIYTIDADRMYAACNHCTTMLKIKPGTGTGSQRKHSKTCPFNKLALLEDLTRLRPEQLPGCFLTRGAFSPKGWQMDNGSWEPLQKKAMSSVGNMMGVKTILEFKPNKGIKVDIGKMELYNGLFPHRDGLFMDESVSLCYVFPKGKGNSPAKKKKGKGPATDPCKGFVAPPLDEDYGVGGSNKRKRGGWEGYTKIYTIDRDRLYAACNHCTTMLKLKANSGTGSQTKHSCLFKKQLLIVTSMDTPSIASGNQGPPRGILSPSTA